MVIMNTADNKIRVAFVLPMLTAGGAERALITLMNNIDHNRFEPHFITLSEQGPMRDIIDPAIPFYSLGISRVSLSLPKLCLQLKRIKPDVVVSTMSHMNLALMSLKPLFPKTRFIVREAITLSYIMDEHRFLSFAVKAAYRILFPMAYAVISPAQIIIDEFRTDLGMKHKNSKLLRNFVEMDRIRKQEDKVFEHDETRKKTVHFIAAGRLNHQKGFDRLVTSLGNAEMPKDWQLTILGEGSERSALEELIKKHGLEDKIFLPGLSTDPWPDFAQADCFLLSSRWEGLPNVVLESLACGTPVIATHESGGIQEIADVSADGSLKVTQSMAEFIDAMKEVKPSPTECFRPSLLPDCFQKDKVISEFEAILYPLPR